MIESCSPVFPSGRWVMGVSFAASPELVRGLKILCGAACPTGIGPFLRQSRRRIDPPSLTAGSPLKNMARPLVLASTTNPVNSELGSLEEHRLAESRQQTYRTDRGCSLEGKVRLL
jgi:hypothetical protein